MPDYKESTVAGTKWQRACRVVIENPLGGTPSIMFVEEEAINLGDGETHTRLVSNVSCTFDPTNVVHIELYQKLNELYMELAAKRDGTWVAPTVEEPPQVTEPDPDLAV